MYVSTLHSSFMPFVNPFCLSIANGDIDWLLGGCWGIGTLRFSLDLVTFFKYSVNQYMSVFYENTKIKIKYKVNCKCLTWNLQDSCPSWSASCQDCCLSSGILPSVCCRTWWFPSSRLCCTPIPDNLVSSLPSAAPIPDSRDVHCWRSASFHPGWDATSATSRCYRSPNSRVTTPARRCTLTDSDCAASSPTRSLRCSLKEKIPILTLARLSVLLLFNYFAPIYNLIIPRS